MFTFQIYSGVIRDDISAGASSRDSYDIRLSRAFMYARTSTRSLESVPRTSHTVVRMSTLTAAVIVAAVENL